MNKRFKSVLNFVVAVARDPKGFASGVGEAGAYIGELISETTRERREERVIRGWSPERQEAFRLLSYDARVEKLHGQPSPVRITRD